MKNISKILAVILSLIMIASTTYAITLAKNYDTTDATSFTFTDDGITADDGAYNGYTIDGTNLSIKAGGTYIVSGSSTDGTITIKKGTTGVVLILNNLNLTSSNTAPIACNKSSEVTIVAESGSVNTLTDNAYNNDENYPDNTNAENAVIKCKDGSKVKLCGSGTINVVSNGKNGIKSGSTTETEGDAYLNIEDVTLNITTTVNDAINAESTLNILSGNITVSATDDAIHSDYNLNIGAENTDGPTIKINESYEGIEGATLNIYSGNIEVHAEEDGINAANGDLTDYSFELNIYGGNIYVDAKTGDGIDSNGTLNIYGGNIDVFSSESSDNAPLDSESTFKVEGGTVFAMGQSGMTQNPNSATQKYITFGAGGFGGGGMMPNDMNNQTTDAPTPPDNTDGNAPQMNGQTPPDMNGQKPQRGDMNGQNGQNMQSSISIKAGDVVKILDSKGNIVYSQTALRNASYVFFTSPNLTEDETYTLTVNDVESASTDNSNMNNGGMIPNQEQGQGQGQTEEQNQEDTQTNTDTDSGTVTDESTDNNNDTNNAQTDDTSSVAENENAIANTDTNINTSANTNNTNNQTDADANDGTNTNTSNITSGSTSTSNSADNVTTGTVSTNPHTGVESNLIIILSVAGVALLGLASAGIVIKKRKGKNN
jgi:hypothetical protein